MRYLDDLRALVQGLTRRGVRVEFLKEELLFTEEDSPHSEPHTLGHGSLR